MTADGVKTFERQAEFARRRGVSRKAVTSWKSKGILVLDGNGRIDVEATEWNLDQRPAKYRGGVTHRPVRKVTSDNPPEGVTSNGQAKPKAKREREVDPPLAQVSEDTDLVDDLSLAGTNLPMAQAVQRKENFLGLLRKHEFEVSQNEWVRVEEVGQLMEREYATVRERVLIIPGKISAQLVGLNRAQIEDRLRQEVTESLNELHDPDGFAERLAAGGADAAGAASVEASANPEPDPMGRPLPKGRK